MKRPAWAASGSFAAAWATLDRKVSLAEDDVRDIRSRGGDPSAITGYPREVLKTLAGSKVVVADGTQVNALPFGSGYPETSFGAWTGDVRLPFASVFLDLGGAQVEQFSEDIGARAVLLAHAGEEGIRAAIWGCTVPGAQNSIARWMGSCRFLGTAEPDFSRQELAVIPVGTGFVTEDAHEEMAKAMREIAERAFALVAWIQSFNVELVETPLSSRQRERELKKGRQIALTVQVKQTKRYTSASQSNGHASYSHRFETRGHYKHYFEFKPDGQPSKVFERCYAKDASRVVMVEGKECFRFWVPPYVKGPIDKPFVPKVREVVA